jgi:hypothetical protein
MRQSTARCVRSGWNKHAIVVGEPNRGPGGTRGVDARFVIANEDSIAEAAHRWLPAKREPRSAERDVISILVARAQEELS